MEKQVVMGSEAIGKRRVDVLKRNDYDFFGCWFTFIFSFLELDELGFRLS